MTTVAERLNTLLALAESSMKWPAFKDIHDRAMKEINLLRTAPLHLDLDTIPRAVPSTTTEPELPLTSNPDVPPDEANDPNPPSASGTRRTTYEGLPGPAEGPSE